MELNFADWYLMESQTGTGRIITNPQPKGRFKTSAREWWMIAEVDDEIGRYHRELFSHWSKAEKLSMPEWGTHVSLVRGEHPRNADKWHEWDGKIIHFTYGHELQTMSHTPYMWVEAKCPDAEAIRLELGLSKEPEYGFHLTVARKATFTRTGHSA